MKRIWIILILLAFVGTACDDENGDDNNAQPDSYLEEFVSLESDVDTLQYCDTTRIVANAVGTNLHYEWGTNSNAPLIPQEGVDSIIWFYADPCVTLGVKQVYCTVTAENDEVMKVDTVVIEE